MDGKKVSIGLPEECRYSSDCLKYGQDPLSRAPSGFVPPYLRLQYTVLLRGGTPPGRVGEAVSVLFRVVYGISACVGGNRGRWAGEYRVGSVEYRQGSEYDRDKGEKIYQGKGNAGGMKSLEERVYSLLCWRVPLSTASHQRLPGPLIPIAVWLRPALSSAAM